MKIKYILIFLIFAALLLNIMLFSKLIISGKTILSIHETYSMNEPLSGTLILQIGQEDIIIKDAQMKLSLSKSGEIVSEKIFSIQDFLGFEPPPASQEICENISSETEICSQETREIMKQECSTEESINSETGETETREICSEVPSQETIETCSVKQEIIENCSAQEIESYYYAQEGIYERGISELIDYAFSEAGEYKLVFSIPSLNIAKEKTLVVEGEEEASLNESESQNESYGDDIGATNETLNLYEPINQTIINATETVNATIENFSEGNLSIETKRYKIVINRPVKWQKKIVSDSNISVEIPKEAENIEIKTGSEIIQAEENAKEEEKLIENKRALITGEAIYGESNGILSRIFLFISGLFKRITGRVIDSEIIEESDGKIVNVDSSEVLIEYETPAPTAVEENLENGKKITISADDELNYTEILAYSELDNSIKLEEKEKIKLYHIENGTRQETLFDAYDLDEDGNIDYIEWIVPHLSEQVYEIIYITKAIELDENRDFVRDIYDFVRYKDDNFTLINSGNYIRVSFERNLTLGNDMTIYARGNGGISVYGENGNISIGEFIINGESEYKIYPEYDNSDVYDLLFSGSIEVDYIVDPQANLSDIVYQCGTIDSPGTYTLNQSISTTGTCINITSNNVVIDGNGSILDGDDTGTADYGIYVNGKSNITIMNFLNITDFTYGIIFANTNNSYIGNLTANSNINYGIYLNSSSNNTITKITANDEWYGILLESSSNNKLSGITTDYRGGIYLESSSSNTLANITANSNNDVGITLYSSSNNNLTNITANSNEGDGIYLYESSNNILSNVTANSNDWNGIYLFSSSSNTLANINASSNYDDSGIYFASSLNNQLTGITANSNDYYGIYLSSDSTGNYLNGTASSNTDYDTYCESTSQDNYNNGLSYTTNYQCSFINLVSSCRIIGSPGNYILSQSILNHNINGYGACINITSDNVTLNGNGYTIDGQYEAPVFNTCHNVYAFGRTNLSVYNLNISECVYGITFASTNNSRINNITFKSNPAAIYIVSSSSNNIISNITSSAQNYGIHAQAGISNSIFSNINFSQPTDDDWYGFTLRESNNNIFNAITVSGYADGYGMEVHGNNNSFSSLKLYSNKMGFSQASSQNCSVSDSNISSNTLRDLDVSAGTINTIFTNVTYIKADVTAGASMTRKWYYQAYVNDSLGNPVSSANVTAYNVSNSHNFNLTTNSSGWTDKTSITDYVNVSGTTTYYSLYTIYASKSGYLTGNSSFNSSLGNNLAHSITLSLPPSVSLTSPLSGTSYSGTSSVSFLFNVTGTNDINNCTVSINNVSYANSTAISKSVINTVSASLSAGSYSCYVACSDILGNSGNSSTISISVTSQTTSENPSGSCLISAWNCGDWSACNNGSQARECKSNCLTKKTETRICQLGCIENWSCEARACSNGTYSPECSDLNNCGTSLTKPQPISCNKDGCIPEISCQSITPCLVYYNLDTLINSIETISGSLKQKCSDVTGCISEYSQSKQCYPKTEVTAKKVIWCNEEYIEVYNLEGKLISRLKQEKQGNFSKMDVSFAISNMTSYCPSCFNRIQDGSETDIDCGGDCKECISLESPKKKSYWWLLLLVILMILILYYLIRKHYKKKRRGY